MSNNVIMSILNESKWKYEVGDLLCAPRHSTNNIWGAIVILERVANLSTKYYVCWSQQAKRSINMPKMVIEEGWYVPKEKDKTTTDTELSS